MEVPLNNGYRDARVDLTPETIAQERLYTGKRIGEIMSAVDLKTNEPIPIEEKIDRLDIFYNEVAWDLDKILDAGGYDVVLVERSGVIQGRLRRLIEAYPEEAAKVHSLMNKRSYERIIAARKREESTGR